MSPETLQPYAAIGATILIVTGAAIAFLLVAHLLGPKRHGPVKDSPYESGMPLITDARQRFNVKFYIIAVLFLLFDVEIIFLWPWAKLYYQAATTGATIPLQDGTMVGKEFLLVGMGIFFALLLFGLVYELGKGALKWD